jgi:regulation of enolase protein 1 (concanavalin A-like superfamily)
MNAMRVRASLLLVSTLFSFRPAIAVAASSTQIENAKPGTLDWKLVTRGFASSAIEGYASLTSVNRGGQIRFFVNTPESQYTIDIFRMGFYGGTGGRRMMNTISRTGVRQAPCPLDATTGLIECNWIDPYVLNIPGTPDPTDWMSGIYLAKLTAGTSGKQQYIIFTVRDDARFSDLIMVQPVNTYQAYNVWGGKSLYGTIASRGDTANAAHKVSFDRPYYGDSGDGAADFVDWEHGMIRWLENEGYDVTYATSVDLDADPNLLVGHKAYLSVGHDEYWTWTMRDHVERARDVGISLGFFSANTSYWQVRLEPSVVNNQPGRTLVGYKEAWRQDPITPDYLKTNQFRYAPVNRPEDAMIGVMYITQARPVMVIEDASSWVFTGTGLRNGDRVTNSDGTPFLGYEVDAMGPHSPVSVQRLAHSPATPAAANFSDMTVYRAPSGATVFATGSINWSQTIPQIQQITRNVLARFIDGAFSDTAPVRPLLPVPFDAKDIGDVGRPGFVALAGPDSFTLNGAGQTQFLGNDALYYVYQPLSGNGTITVRLTALQLYWGNRAGVMIRESLSPDAKYVSLVGRPSDSRGTLLEGAELRIKDVVGGKPQRLVGYDLKLPNWLRLTRTGDDFTSLVSADGVTWVPLGSVTVPMASTVYIGVSVASAQHGVWATASFDHVSVTGAPDVTPTLPNGWARTDIGAVGVPGTASFNITTSTFTVAGAGADVWNTADAFQYAYTTLPGDGRIVARVASVQNVAAWTKAGVMIRASLDPASAHAFMVVSAGKGLAFQRRTSTGGLSVSTAGGLVAAPRWIRLDRAATTISAYQSGDGVTWTLVGADTIPMATQVIVGLAVSSHTTAATGTALFDNVTITSVAPPPPPPPPSTCPVTPDKVSAYSGAGASGTPTAATWYINVTAGTCGWTARSDVDWLEVKHPTSGVYLHTTDVAFTGSYAVKVHTLTNTGAKRVGQFIINGVVYTVTQEPAAGF